ncbi:hypothetical protein BK131_04375 [Paenibacillus amylolyticus]|uniref:Zinc-finger domain-containing protein n=1 Tax=Paenibacillus amylolyticus TaxID=1451 RepID=A0A1R1C514_PAEAM|nr:hypothetical protein BK131_04375 [Paenibacillus amylolyticus]
MSRLNVLTEINLLMNQKCKGCKTHYELSKLHGSNFSKIDNHCNKQCDVGKQIQELGKQLTK